MRIVLLALLTLSMSRFIAPAERSEVRREERKLSRLRQHPQRHASQGRRVYSGRREVREEAKGGLALQPSAERIGSTQSSARHGEARQ